MVLAPVSTASSEARSSSTVRPVDSAAMNRAVALSNPESARGRTRPS